MNRVDSRFVFLIATLLAAAPAATPAAPAFEGEVAPILKQKCWACHGDNSPQGQLDLRSPESILKGGKSGSAITPGSAERSLLVEKIVSGAMPPVGEKVTEKEIQRVRHWIDEEAAEHVAAVSEKDVLPIFQMRCVVCHGKRRQEAGLDLRTRESRLRGGESGPAMVSGKPEESLLMKRILAEEMPPADKLFEFQVRPPSSGEVETLRRWIAAGSPADPSEPTRAKASEAVLSEEDENFWAFQAPRRPSLPVVKRGESARNPIDAFLLRKLEEKGLGYSPEAGKLTLLRRAYLALIGMPPTPEEIDAYLGDRRPDAYERMLDRLLESQHYGERWAQYWLDSVGYADSEGVIHEDRLRKHAWRYRDYVIRAFNDDKPYDQFLSEQLAADELIDYRNLEEITPEVVNTLAATGFLRMTPDGTYSPANGSISERMNVIADEIQVLSSTVMGLTIGCARCHDHKYDPISQRDYYRLSAIFQSAYDPYDWVKPTQRHLDIAPESEREEAAAWNKPIESKIERVERSWKATADPLRDQILEERFSKLAEPVRQDLSKLIDTPEEKRSATEKKLAQEHKNVLEVTDEYLVERFPDYKEQWEQTSKETAELKAKLRAEPKIRALFDMGGEPSPAYLLHRGEAQIIRERVYPGVPRILEARLEPYRASPPEPEGQTSGYRLALARWLTRSDHPLTARVMVNRIWRHHFGRGLVASAANFGKTGVAPSHPELLDWLATEFVRSGWSVKHMHRLIMTSAAYRQSSRVDPAVEAGDPENILLSRMPMRRMDAEALYDSVLRVTGRLNPTPFGEPDEVERKADGEIEAPGTKAGRRRAIYVLHRRKTPVTMLDVFDLPQLNPNCSERAESTVAPQALQMMNGDTVRDHSRYLAGRLMDAFPGNRGKQIEQAYLRSLSRSPSEEEIAVALASLDELTRHWTQHLESENHDEPRAARARWLALGSFCRAMLSSAAFLYAD